MKLLGHILRIPTETDPVKICATDEHMQAHIRSNTRVGRPRYKWTNEVLKQAWMETEKGRAPFLLHGIQLGRGALVADD